MYAYGSLSMFPAVKSQTPDDIVMIYLMQMQTFLIFFLYSIILGSNSEKSFIDLLIDKETANDKP